MRRLFKIIAWGLYDFANTFFTLNVVSLYFALWVTVEKGAPEIYYSLFFGASTFAVAIMAPIMGSISDILRKHNPFLVLFTLISVLFTMALSGTKGLFWGLLFFALANFGCQAAVIFYNALMVRIVPEGKIGLVSGIGKMLGYCGTIVGLYLIRPIVAKSGYQAAFLPTGILFFIFALPCMLFIKDQKVKEKQKFSSVIRKDNMLRIFKQLKQLAFDSERFPGFIQFLKGAFFGLCAVNTILLFMAVYAKQALGLSDAQIVNLLAVSTIFAILGSLASGYISDFIGYRRSIIVIFILWGICLLVGSLARTTYLYWVIGPTVGVTLGSTWVVSRAMAIRLVPASRMGEVFGLFDLVGKLSAVVGPIYFGLVRLVLSPLGEWSYRIALLSLLLFLAVSIYYFRRIPLDSLSEIS